MQLLLKMVDEIVVFVSSDRDCVSAIRNERNRKQRVAQTCKICGKTLAHKVSLQYHLKKHLNERPHRCDRPGCEKAYVEIWALRM